MTGTVILLALTLVTLATFLAAEHRDEIRAWVNREPARLDVELGHKYRCGRPGCRVNHGGH